MPLEESLPDRPRQIVWHFADEIFKFIFLYEKLCILIQNSLKFVPNCPLNNTPALIQIRFLH